MLLRHVTLAVAIPLVLVALLAACTASAPATPQAAEPTAVASTDETADEVENEVDKEVDEVVDEPVGDQATVVVQFDDSRMIVRKVDFTPPISGLALLEQSGLDVVKADFDWGTAVCSIEDVGCPADDCFCNQNTFWSYLYGTDNGWMSYPVGPAQSVITTTGALEGWQWGTGETPPSPPDRAGAAYKALAWIRSRQVITDGSYGSSAAASVETLMALGANHEDADSWRPAAGVSSLLDFMLENGGKYSQEGVSEAGKLAVALSAVEACWPADAMKPSDYYSQTLGSLHTDAGHLAWGILGTLALDEPTPTDSVEYLTQLALPEGGWEWTPGWGRDTNSTSLAMQALLAAGTPVTSSVIISALAYLQEAHASEGGFSYDPNASWGNVADSNSTAYVLQALAALRPQPADSAMEAMEDEAVAFLVGLQGEEGAIGWQVTQPAPNLGSTQQAVPALLGRPYPIRRVPLPACGE